VAPGYTFLPLSDRFVNAAIDRAGVRGGFDPDEASPMAAIVHTRAPVLLLHGQDDRRVPPWHSRLIFAGARDHAELVLLPDVGHSSILHSPAVPERARIWFDAYLGGPAAAPSGAMGPMPTPAVVTPP
jgi:pimeloyl-ACP methyl ester carboxylesterase